jgi:hypothetical protein
MKRHHRPRGQAHDLGRRKRLAAAEARIRAAVRTPSTETLAAGLVRRGLASPLILDRPWRVLAADQEVSA